MSECIVKSLCHSYYMRIDLGEFIISQVGNLLVRKHHGSLSVFVTKGVMT